MKYFLTICTLLCLATAGCKKTLEDELSKLPPATKIGARTFGCLVNGKAWIPDNDCTLLCPPDLKFYYDNSNGGEFSVLAILKVNGRDERVAFGFYPCNQSGTKTLISHDTSSIASFINYATIPWSTISSKDADVTVNGLIVIDRFDFSQAIISGRFEFTLIKLGYETIQITNGRFDAKL
jgi:hypothetical protein